tara:strand:- start:28 stop:525 length:498 start_codon:yes stop_codon:yes gene_type:complete
MENISIKYCLNGCCKIKISPYNTNNLKCYRNNNPQKKSGVFIFDKSKNKILLVQSKGNLWGIPKGTADKDEDLKNCAVREVKEETGLELNLELLTNSINIYNKALYFYIELEECEVEIQNTIVDNDANGICWINLDCLKKLIFSKQMTLNKHTVLLLEKFIQVKI